MGQLPDGAVAVGRPKRRMGELRDMHVVRVAHGDIHRRLHVVGVLGAAVGRLHGGHEVPTGVQHGFPVAKFLEWTQDVCDREWSRMRLGAQ